MTDDQWKQLDDLMAPEAPVPGSFSRQEFEKRFHLANERVAYRKLQRFQRQGLIKKIGRGNAVRYVYVKPDPIPPYTDYPGVTELMDREGAK